jgi:sulfur carrier protein
MKLVINGKDADINGKLTVIQLLARENVKMPEMVSVELNGEILKRSDFEKKALEDGDAVEFLYFMGGGHGII